MIELILQLWGLSSSLLLWGLPSHSSEDWLHTAALRMVFISESVRTPFTQLWGLSSSLNLWGLPSHSFEDCLHLCICEDCLHTVLRTVFTSAAFRTVFVYTALRTVFICAALKSSSLLFCSVFFFFYGYFSEQLGRWEGGNVISQASACSVTAVYMRKLSKLTECKFSIRYVWEH